MSINDIRQAVLTGRRRSGGATRARRSWKPGHEASVIMNEALISAMDEAGGMMATGELFIPEVLVAAEAMKAAMDVITPHLAVEASGGRGTVVIGAVEGDVHDIGKSLVALMLDGAGFTVFDLGVDVAPDAFVAAAQGARRRRRRHVVADGDDHAEDEGRHRRPARGLADGEADRRRRAAHAGVRGRDRRRRLRAGRRRRGAPRARAGLAGAQASEGAADRRSAAPLCVRR